MQTSPIYVPVVRWKGSEQQALARLSDATKLLTHPIIELVPKSFRNRSPQRILENAAKQIAENWGWTHSHFIDFYPVRNMVAGADLTFLSQRRYSSKAIFVVHLDYYSEFLVALKAGLQRLGTGAAFRLSY